jgi:hypothetical protein
MTSCSSFSDKNRDVIESTKKFNNTFNQSHNEEEKASRVTFNDMLADLLNFVCSKEENSIACGAFQVKSPRGGTMGPRISSKFFSWILINLMYKFILAKLSKMKSQFSAAY